MKVKLAATAGFCYGVERAVNMVYHEIEERGQSDGVYTLGPIVHNDMVVNDLVAHGVKVISDTKALRELAESGRLSGRTVVIRAHGTGDEERKLLSASGARVVDATCPHVSRIHDIVREHHAKGELIVVTGSPDHPEVRGILGCIGNDAVVIDDREEAEKMLDDPLTLERFSGETVCIVSQTTFNLTKFEDIVDIFKKKLYHTLVVNTICNATQRRQMEAAALSAECDAMIVIGGRNSSNTAKLFGICDSLCEATYFIQCLDDLKKVTIKDSVRCVGITAGASTPKNIIEEVLNYVRTEF